MTYAVTDHITPIWVSPCPPTVSGICGADLTVIGIDRTTIITIPRTAPTDHTTAVLAATDLHHTTEAPAASAAAVLAAAEVAAALEAAVFPAVTEVAAAEAAASAAVAAEDADKKT